jgi:hypothetical protein
MGSLEPLSFCAGGELFVRRQPVYGQGWITSTGVFVPAFIEL